MTSPFYTGGPLVAAPPPPGFDFTSIGQRSATFGFALIELDGFRDPDPLTPLKGSNPSLTHDTTRTVKRTLTLALGVGDTARFDPVRHRVEVSMTVGGATYPLGRYMAADRTRAGSTAGNQASVLFTDEMAQVATPLQRGFSTPQAVSGVNRTGENIASLMRTLLDRFRLFDPRDEWGGMDSATIQSGGYIPVEIDIDPTPYLSNAAWRTGTSGAQVVEDLALAGDYWSPWMDNTGNFRAVRTFDPSDISVAPLSNWDATDAVIRSSVSYTDDLLTASNRFIVISNKGAGDNATGEIVATFDAPDDAPWSIANRGFVIPEVHDVQVDNVAAARALVRNIGMRQQVFERAQVATPPDPRHDSYDVVIWNGVRWLELAWTMSLIEGAPMVHTLRRVYDNA